MMKEGVIAQTVEGAHGFQTPHDITHVCLEWGELTVTLRCSGEQKGAIVKFSAIVGMRLLDEGDLLEFWPACASEHGWLFRILQNGWFDLEASRSGFLRDKELGMSEFFIASQNNCLSILTGAQPVIEIFSI